MSSDKKSCVWWNFIPLVVQVLDILFRFLKGLDDDDGADEPKK